MGHLSSMFNGLASSLSINRRKYLGTGCSAHGRETVEDMLKEAKKNDLILRSSGFVNVDGSNNFASVYTKRGQKGINQDSCIVWEEFGCQPDLMFCGIFDGHGPWGHYVSKMVRESMPTSLLHAWQETLARAAINLEFELDDVDKKMQWFNIWKHSYLKTCADVDRDLEHHRKIDAFYSGTTALSIVRQVELQKVDISHGLSLASLEPGVSSATTSLSLKTGGERMIIANVGDSRAVLATTSGDGSLTAVQLTVDFKPNLPEEASRIGECNGRVFSLDDEPGVHRVWLPDEELPGLAMSRAFGDHCIKDFGLISVPDVTQILISSKDHFLVLATDGVWDVVSNEEAVGIVSSSPDRAKSAKRLVKHAAQAWKQKRRGYAADDISAICLFFHSGVSSAVCG